MDMGKYGVTCNAIRPRAGTGMTSAPGLKEAWEKAKAKGLPTVGTEITPEEMEKITPDMVAPLVVYLASDEAASINGRTFWIIGGEIGLYSEPEVVRSIYKDGAWTLDELVDIMPKSLSKGLVNPAPPQLPK